MKKTILILFISLFISTALAEYTPTTKDEKLLDSVYPKVDKIISQNREKAESISSKISSLTKDMKQDTRKYYILQELQDYIKNNLKNSQKEKEEKGSTQKNSDTFTKKEQFFSKYGSGILTDMNSINRCMKRYEQIDKIGKEMDFPTPLIISTWWMETTCKLKNPENKHGLFQLRGRDYGTGEITEKEFKKQIREFIKFSKNKREWQNNSHIAGETEIDISYNDYTMEELRTHGYLYNGLYDRTTPETSMYNNGNLNSEFEHKKDGLITVFLKALKREIENK